MTYLVRYLQCKCEVLSLDVQHPCKSQVQCCTCNLSAEVGVGREGLLELLASQPSLTGELQV